MPMLQLDWVTPPLQPRFLVSISDARIKHSLMMIYRRWRERKISAFIWAAMNAFKFGTKPTSATRLETTCAVHFYYYRNEQINVLFSVPFVKIFFFVLFRSRIHRAPNEWQISYSFACAIHLFHLYIHRANGNDDVNVSYSLLNFVLLKQSEHTWNASKTLFTSSWGWFSGAPSNKYKLFISPGGNILSTTTQMCSCRRCSTLSSICRSGRMFSIENSFHFVCLRAHAPRAPYSYVQIFSNHRMVLFLSPHRTDIGDAKMQSFSFVRCSQWHRM